MTEEVQVQEMTPSTVAESPITTGNLQHPSMYHPLPVDSKWIRVLDILPASGQEADNEAAPVRCALREINLAKDTEFAALSYVWGKDPLSTQYPVLCDGQRVPVTSNCFQAIFHLRAKFGKLTIWIDAICINQEDTKEKETQIPLMGDIYSTATKMLVWLGTGTTQTDRAMRYLSDTSLHRYFTLDGSQYTARPLAAMWHILWNDCNWSMTIRPRLSTLDSDDDSSNNVYTNLKEGTRPWHIASKFATFDDLNLLLSNVWLTRLWTYQEMLLAPDPVLVCGMEHVPWPIFERNVQFISSYQILAGNAARWEHITLARGQFGPKQDCSAVSIARAANDYAAFKVQVWSVYHQTRRWILFSLFVLFGLLIGVASITATGAGPGTAFVTMSFFLAVYPSYLIVMTIRVGYRTGPITPALPLTAYQSLGLMNGLIFRECSNPRDMAFGMWAILQQNGALNLPVPDYSASIGEIYRMLTVHVIKVTNSLVPVMSALKFPFASQPSWVPNWNAYDRQGALGSLMGYQHPSLDFSSIRESLPVYHFDDNQLRISALPIGEIIACVQPRETSNEYIESERAIHLENMELLRVKGLYSPLKRGKIGRFETYILYYGIVDERDGRQWAEFCTQHHAKSPETILSLLCADKTRSFRYLGRKYKVHSAQIRICNHYAADANSLVIVKPADGAENMYMGKAQNGCCVGDQVICVPSLTSFPVIRPNADAGGTFTIVSNAVLGSAQSDDDQRKIDEGWESRCVEYTFI